MGVLKKLDNYFKKKELIVEELFHTKISDNEEIAITWTITKGLSVGKIDLTKKDLLKREDFRLNSRFLKELGFFFKQNNINHKKIFEVKLDDEVIVLDWNKDEGFKFRNLKIKA